VAAMIRVMNHAGSGAAMLERHLQGRHVAVRGPRAVRARLRVL
jgi:hypothetical protein